MAENFDYSKFHEHACNRFKCVVNGIEDMDGVFRALGKLSASPGLNPAINGKLVETLVNKHLYELLKHPRYRQLSENDSKKALKHLDRTDVPALRFCFICTHGKRATQ